MHFYRPGSVTTSILVVIVLLSLATVSACGSRDSGQPGSGASVFHNVPGTGVPTIAANATEPLANQSFTLLDNSRGHMTAYLGHVVVLDFWATYCEPCTREAPQLNALQQELGPAGLQVVGLNVGGEDDKPKIAAFIAGTSPGYALGYPDPEMAALYLGDDQRIPQTFVFDRQGKLVRHFVGYNDDVEKGIRSAVESSLAEPGK